MAGSLRYYLANRDFSSTQEIFWMVHLPLLKGYPTRNMQDSVSNLDTFRTLPTRSLSLPSSCGRVKSTAQKPATDLAWGVEGEKYAPDALEERAVCGASDCVRTQVG